MTLALSLYIDPAKRPEVRPIDPYRRCPQFAFRRVFRAASLRRLFSRHAYAATHPQCSPIRRGAARDSGSIHSRADKGESPARRAWPWNHGCKPFRPPSTIGPAPAPTKDPADGRIAPDFGHCSPVAGKEWPHYIAMTGSRCIFPLILDLYELSVRRAFMRARRGVAQPINGEKAKGKHTMQSKTFLLVSTGLAVSAMAPWATAQAQTTSAGSSATTVNEVVVTAQHRSERLENVPMSVVAVSPLRSPASPVSTISIRSHPVCRSISRAAAPSPRSAGSPP
jgi:hypothetical protein